MGLGGVKETRRVELHKLHILDRTFGTIDHGDTVTGSYLRVGRRRIDSTRSTGSHEGDSAEIGVYFLRLGVEDVGAVALDVGCPTRHTYTEVVLRDDLYCKMVLQYLNMGVLPNGFHQSALDLKTGIIGMVQDTELGVTAFAVQVKLSVFFLIEVNAPVD